jgi:hypothetical protein
MSAKTLFANWIRCLASPGGVAALALCAAFPFVWQHLAPTLQGASSVVLLSPVDARRAEWPSDGIPLTDRDNAKVGAGRRIRGNFEMPRGGRFSVIGLSAQPHAEPVEVAINGKPVSAAAFYQRTDGAIARQRIATNVTLSEGPNEISMYSDLMHGRTLALELYLEQPLDLLRYAARFALMAALLAARALWVARVRLGPRSRLNFALLGYAGSIAASALWLVSGAEADRYLRELGITRTDSLMALEGFEAELRSEAHAMAVRDRYSVVVLGDSTHFHNPTEGARMIPQLRRALAEPLRDTFHWFGVAAGGFNAVDYYLIANLLVENPPDLVVIPVNLRSFAPAWLQNPGYRVRDLDRYLQPGELPYTRALSAGGRDLPVAGWLLRRLDARWFDAETERWLRGAKILAERESERIVRGVGERIGLPSPPRSAAVKPDAIEWPPQIGPHHELFQAFELLNGLAARAGFEILYYTVIPNLDALTRRGIDVNATENFDRIEREIGKAPGVHFLSVGTSLPESMFRDEIDHMRPAGIEWTAARIASRAAEIRAEAGSGAR